MKTSECYRKEIKYISNPALQKIVVEVMDASPDCIQTIPASSTLKYHPAYACETGGLMKHTKASVGIARSLMKADLFRDFVLGVDSANKENLAILKDVVIAALIMHDCMKPDYSEKRHTLFEHPLLAAYLFRETARKYITQDNMEYMKMVVPLIHGCIASHMGKWNTNRRSPAVLPVPKNKCEQMVHLCDYLASRRFLEYNFDIEED